MIIEPNYVSIDQGEVTAIANQPKPYNLQDIQGFLSFVNFYRQFIKNFSAKVYSLNDLTKKNMPWHWKEDEKATFTMLKQAFTEALVLAFYDPSQLTEVKVDASNFTTGGVLLQKDNDG